MMINVLIGNWLSFERTLLIFVLSVIKVFM